MLAAGSGRLMPQRFQADLSIRSLTETLFSAYLVRMMRTGPCLERCLQSARARLRECILSHTSRQA